MGYDEKYGSLSRRELEAHAQLLESDLRQVFSVLAEEWFAAGRYEEEIVDPGGTADIAGDYHDDPNLPHSPVHLARARHWLNDEGKHVVQVVDIPPGQDPVLDALKEEVGWLYNRIRHLEISEIEENNRR